jgi:antitoxin PrlF
MKTTVSEKGQVTIPKSLRDQLGIRPGEVLNFEAEKGRLVATKARAQDAVDAMYGVLKLNESTDTLIKSLRGGVDAV